MRLIIAALVTLLAFLAACEDDSQDPGTPGSSPTPTGAATSTMTATPQPTGLPTPTFTPVPLPSFAQLSAPSSEVVWALVANRLLFVSADRGETWELRSLPGGEGFPMISFIDEQAGSLLRTAPVMPTDTCLNQGIALWRTADGARTWQEVATNGFNEPLCKWFVSFTDASHGFIVAAAPDLAALVYRTDDGGTTWTPSAPLPDIPGFSPQSGSGPALGAVVARGDGLLLPTIPQGDDQHVFGSDDGGVSWRHIAGGPYNFVPMRGGPSRAESYVPGTLALPTATRWLLIGPPGMSQETTDAGASWHPFETDYTQAAPVPPAITFADAEVGYATVRGSIQRTLDGGAHWEPIETPGTVR